jgi:hypothetical protein
MRTTSTLHRCFGTLVFSVCWVLAFVSSAQQHHVLPTSGHAEITAIPGATLGNTLLNGRYQNNSDGSITILPAYSGGKVEIEVTQWSLDCEGDYLYVYDGVNTDARLAGGFSCKAPQGRVSCGATNDNGALTLRFVSNAYVSAAGFTAKISTKCSGGYIEARSLDDPSQYQAELKVAGNAPDQYQWQVSLDGVDGWEDVPGATQKTYTTPALTHTLFYRLRTTCETGTTAISPATHIDVPERYRKAIEKSDVAKTLACAPGSPACVAGEVTTTINAIPRSICRGQTVRLVGTASTSAVSFFDEFDAGTTLNATRWNTAVTNGRIDTKCGCPPAGVSSGCNTLYFESDDVTRNATTVALNTRDACGSLTFWIVLGPGNTSGTAGITLDCESPDICGEEEVFIDYSIDGTTWTRMFTFSIDGGPSSCRNVTTPVDPTGPDPWRGNWTYMDIPIPLEARTAATRFRWRQNNSSGGPFDRWAIDDVRINSGCFEYEWSAPTCGGLPIPIPDTVSSVIARPTCAPGIVTYTLCAYRLDGAVPPARTCCQCESIDVTIRAAPVPSVTADHTICEVSATSTRIPTPLALTGHGTATIVRWESTDNCAAGGPFLPISNTTTSFDPTSAALNAVAGRSIGYRAVINDATCGRIPSNTVCINVTAKPTAPVVPDVSFCRGFTTPTARVTSPVAGSTYLWYNVATGGTSVNTGTTWTSVPTGASATYYIERVVGACTSDRSSFRVTITALTPPAVTDRSFCRGDITAQLEVTSPGPAATTGKFDWYRSSVGGAVIGGVTAPGRIFTDGGGLAATDGTFTFYVEHVELGCTSTRMPVEVRVGVPDGPTVPARSFCTGQTPAEVCVTGPVGGTNYEWYDRPTGGTRLFTGTCFSPTTAAAGTFVFYVQAVVGASGCVSRRTAVVVTVTDLEIPVASPPAPVCAGRTADLASSHVATGLYFWFDRATGGTLMSPTAGLADRVTWTTPPITVDPTCFYLEHRNGSCISPRREVCIPFDATAPGAPVAPDLTVCPSTAITLRVTGPSTPTGVRFSWFEGAPVLGGTGLTFAAASGAGVVVPGRTPGTYTFQVESSITGGCASPRRNVIVTVPAPPTPGTLGPDVTVCSGGATTLTLTGFTGLVDQWEEATLTAGTCGAFNPITPAVTTPTFTTPTLFASACYRVRIGPATCGTAISPPIRVTLSGSITPGVSEAQEGGTWRREVSICGTQNVPIRLSGMGSSGERVVRWERANNTDCRTSFGPTITTLAITTTITTITGVSEFTCFRAIVEKAGCGEVPSPPAVVNIIPLTPGDLTANQTICEGSRPATLRLTGQLGTIRQWETTSTISAGRCTFSGVGWTILTTVTVDNFAPPVLTAPRCYRVVVTNGTCLPQFSDTVIINTARPSDVGPVTGATTVCTGSDSPLLSVDPTTIVGTPVRWEFSENFATGPIFPIPPPTTNTLVFPALSVRTCFRLMVQNAPCPIDSSTIACVDVDLRSAAGRAGPDQTICSGTIPAMLSLTGTPTLRGTVTDWISTTDFITYTTVSPRVTATTFTPPALTSRRCYRAIVRNGACSPDTSAAACIDVDALTAPSTVTANATICEGGSSGVLVVTKTQPAAVVVRWESANCAFSSAVTNIVNTNETHTATGITTTTGYRAVLKNGSCPEVPSSAACITVVPQSDGGRLSADQFICTGDSTNLMTLTGQRGTIINWIIDEGSGFIQATPTRTTPTWRTGRILTPTRFGVLVENAPCPIDTSTFLTVTLEAPTNGGTINADQIICAGQRAAPLTLTGQVGRIIRWESAPSDVFSRLATTTIGNTTTTLDPGSPAATICYRALVRNGICDTLPARFACITVNPAPTPGTISGGREICSGQTATSQVRGHRGTVQRVEWSNTATPFTVIGNQVTSDSNFTSGPLTAPRCFRFVINRSSCTEVFSAPTCFTITPAPDAGTLAANSTVCETALMPTLRVTGVTGGTIEKWQISADGTTFTDLPANTTVNQLASNIVGRRTYRSIAIDSRGCRRDTTNTVVVQVDPRTVAGTLAADRRVCSGEPGGTLNLTGNVGTVTRWERSTTRTGTFTDDGNVGNTNLVLGPLTAGECYRVIVQSASCNPETTNVVCVDVVPTISGGTLRPDTTICSGGSVTFRWAGSTGTFARVESSLDGTFTPATTTSFTSAPFTVTGLTTRTCFRVVVASPDPACPFAFSTPACVNVDLPTLAGTLLSPATVCTGINTGTINLTGNRGGVVNWVSSATGTAPYTVIPNTTAAQPYTNLATRTCYRAVSRNGVCPTDTAAPVCITLDPRSVAGTIAPPATVCSGTNTGRLTLTGRTGVVTGWLVDGAAVVPANTSDILDYTNLTARTCYRAIVRSGTCAPDTTPQTCITVDERSVAGTITGPATVCAGANSGTLVLSGHRGNIDGWLVGSATTLVNPGSTTIGYTNLAANTDYRVVLRNGVCPAETSATVVITVDAFSIGGTLAGPATVCETSNTGTLTLTGLRGTIDNWQQSADCITFTPFSPVRTAPNFTYNNLSATTCYRVFVQNGSCPPVFSDTVRIQVDPRSVGGVLTGVATVCNGERSASMSVTGFNQNITGWIQYPLGSPAAATIIPGQLTASFQSPPLTASTCFRVIARSGVCQPDTSNEVCTTVLPTVDPGNVTPNDTICAGEIGPLLTFRTTSPVFTMRRWESSTTEGFDAGTVTNIPNTTSTWPSGTLSETTWFRVVLASGGSCPEVFSLPAKITVDQQPIAGTITSPQTICIGTAAANLNLSGSFGSILRWESQVGGTITTITNTTTVFAPGAITTSTCYRAVVGNGVCLPVVTPDVCIQVDQRPTPPNAGIDQTICSANVTLTGNAITTGTGRWELVSGTGTIASPTTPVTNITGMTVGAVNRFRWTSRNGVCPLIADTVAIQVDGNPVAANAGIDQLICAATTTLQGNAVAPLPSARGAWRVISGGATITNPAQNNSTVTALIEGTTRLEWTISNGVCPPTRDTVSIRRDSLPTRADAGPDQRLCATSAILIANAPEAGRGRGIWTLGRGIGTIVSPNSPVSNTTGLGEGFNVFVWTISNGVCPPSIDSVTIRRDSIPTNPVAGPDQLICISDGVANLNGNTPAFGRGTGRWEVISPASALVSPATSAATVASRMNVGRNTFRWIISNGTCPSLADTVVINTDDLTIPGEVTGGRVVCFGTNGGNVNLSGNRGVVLGWERSVNGAAFASIPSTAGVLSVSYSNLTLPTCYRAIIRNGVCAPLPSLQTCFTVDQLALGGSISSDITVCENDQQNRFLTLSNHRSQILGWESSTDRNFSPGTVTAIPNTTPIQSYSGLMVTTYYRAIVRNGECPATFSDTAEVRVVLPRLTLAKNDVTCFGGSDGNVIATVVGGLPFTVGRAYNYQWTKDGINFAITQNLNDVGEGTYCVTVTDAIGCTAQACQTVIENSRLNLTLDALNMATCSGNTDGSARISVSGGTGGYRFEWYISGTATPIARTQNLLNVGPGTYNVRVFDANNCRADLGPLVITQPSPIISTLSYSQPVRCFGGRDGAIGINVSGGVPPYTYRWSNSSTDEDPSGLIAGTYVLTVTDRNNCRLVVSYNVSQPPRLRINLSQMTNVTCNEGMNGAIGVDVLGGVPRYTYIWSSGQTVEDLEGVRSGRYTLTVRDANLCVASRSFTVAQPTPVTATISVVSNVRCANDGSGALRVVPAGGVSPYRYLWSTGATTQTASGLNSGTYAVTVTDAQGCQKVFNHTMTANSPIRIIEEQIDHVKCRGLRTGTIAITVEGGTGNYTYQWQDLADVTQDLFNIPAGTYSLTISDESNCRLTKSFVVNQPVEALTATIANVRQVSCNGQVDGSINLTVNGGTAPYRYSWSNTATTEDLVNIGPNRYAVTVTDANNCVANAQVDIAAPETFNLVTSFIKQVSCNGGRDGSIALRPEGGTQPYRFEWEHGPTSENLVDLAADTYRLKVTDARGCVINRSYTITAPDAISIALARVISARCANSADGGAEVVVTGGVAPYSYEWSATETDRILTNSPRGTRTVMVRDAEGCIKTLSVDIPAPAPITITQTSRQSVRCAGGSNGSIAVTASGGSGLIRFDWFNGSTTAIGTGVTATSLSAGTYRVVATDEANCSTEATFTITQPQPLLATIATTPASCNGATDGSAIVTVTGGTPAYSFLWNTGFTGTVITNAIGGDYSVIVTDRNGCRTRANAGIVAPTAIALAVEAIQPVACRGNATGAINLAVNGGSAPYTYRWSNFSTNANLTAAPAGTYSVTVTDSRSCSAVLDNLVINEPARILTITTSYAELPRCGCGTDAAIGIDVSGGSEPYTYLWSNTMTTEDITNVGPGSYIVTVTDANGCSETHTQAIECGARQLEASVIRVQGPTCNGRTDGLIDINVVGGTAPLRFRWSNGSQVEDPRNLTGGLHTVVITDAKGCTVTQTVDVPNTGALSIQGVTRPSGCGTLGSITLTVTGGTAPYAYRWNTGPTTANLDNLQPGEYSVMVSDASSCTAMQTFTIDAVTGLTASVRVQNVSCNGLTDGGIQVDVDGGTTPYTYLWSNRTTEEDLSNVGAGTYTLLVRDANNCQLTITRTIEQSSALVLTPGMVREITCGNLNNGMINVNVSGGVPPYTYRWSTGATTRGITMLGNGVYVLTVTDANGCSAIYRKEMLAPAPLVLTQESFSPITCAGANDGRSMYAVTGGTSPYLFSWNTTPANTTSGIENMAPGVYTLTVRDARGCIAATSVNFVNPAPIAINVLAVRNATCNSTDMGLIDIDPVGGTQPFSYLWSNGSRTQDLVGIAGGTYTVVVTDANGCIATKEVKVEAIRNFEVNIESPTQFCENGESVQFVGTPVGGLFDGTGITAGGVFNPRLAGIGTFEIRYSGTSGGCEFETRKTITVSAAPATATITANGTPQTTFCASDSREFILGFAPIERFVRAEFSGPGVNSRGTGFNPSIAGVGVHTITGTLINSATGCSTAVSQTFTVSNASLLTLSASQTVVCNGASATIAAAGGGTTYAWAPTTGLNCGASCSAFGPSVTASPTTTTTYTVTSNVNGCINSQTIRIEVQQTPAVVARASASLVCAGTPVDLSAVSIGTDYTYTWTGVGLESNTGANVRAIPTANTTYTVTATTPSGCSRSAQVLVSVTPARVTVAANRNDICPGTDVALTANTTESGSFDYSWSPSTGLSSTTGRFVTARPTTTTTYMVTRTGTGSCLTAAITVRVKTPTAPTIAGLPASTCLSATPLTLVGSPAGGTFSGPGVAGSAFNPALLPGAGIVSVAYRVTDPTTGCAVSTSQSIVVDAQAAAAINNLRSTYCIISAPVTLEPVPAGGNLVGPGIVGNVFNPAAAGPGTHQLTYSGTAPNGCTFNSSYTVIVSNVETVVMDAPTQVCVNNGSITLNAIPLGGTFSGRGVEGNTFNPTAAGVGPHAITYSGTNGACAFSLTQVVNVVSTGDNCVASNCQAPTVLSATPSATASTVSWTSVAGAAGYELSFGEDRPAAPRITISVTGTSFTLTGLNPATAYVVQVRTLCNNGPSDLSAAQRFTTQPASCDAPVLANAVVTRTSATVNWSAVPGATEFIVSWREDVFGSTFVSTTVSGTSFTISGLNPGRRYMVRVRSRCGANLSPFSNIVNFTTSALREASDAASSQSLEFSVYPNPAKDQFSLQFSTPEAAQLSLQLYSTAGALVFAQTHTVDAGTHSLVIPVNTFPAGVYQLLVNNGTQQQQIKIIVH